MEGNNLKNQLQVLIGLQTIDSQIFKLNIQKESKPQEIKAIEAAFEEKKQKLAALEKTHLDFQKQKKEAELELATREEATKKLQSQLFSLKTNKEYQTMLQQISDSKADGSVIEEKILVLFDQIDKVKTEVEKEKAVLSQEEKVADEQKKKVTDQIKEIEAQMSQLETQRKQILPQVDKTILAQYEKILQIRPGLAIVKVENNSCLGCHMFVPPQVINLIRMYEQIITCDVCNRILYVEDGTS